MAKISVVMCCYNCERFIRETIDSVLNQTYRDFEFIIWNDGSNDGTQAIIESYTDSRIHLFSDINRGEGMAAKLACSKVNSEYIARIDADDVWFPNKLQLQYEYMKMHPNVVMCSSPVVFIDSSSSILGYSFPVTITKYLKKDILSSNRFVHSGSFYKSDIYRKVGGYNDVRLFQDHLLFRKLVEFGDIALLPNPLVKYRLLPNSVAHRVENSPYEPTLIALKIKILNDMGKCDNDIRLFNEIYGLIGKRQNHVFLYKKDIQNILFDFLRTMLGLKNAYRTIVGLKNLWAIISLTKK